METVNVMLFMEDNGDRQDILTRADEERNEDSFMLYYLHTVAQPYACIR